MKWEPNGKYALVSGRYIITKAITGQGTVYLCHFDKQVIGRVMDGGEAKILCESHAKGGVAPAT